VALMSGISTVIALSDNQSAWTYTLIVGLVVLLVVIALLETLRRSVRWLDKSLWTTWVAGKSVVKHTGTTYLLKNTRQSGEELVEELNNHG
jgi:type II secretory pathway component PulF